MACVDLKKTFDCVRRRVIWWALRKPGVDEEGLLRPMQSMYENVRSRVRVCCNLSEEFSVKVGVHHGSCWSPLLFIMVLDALSKEFRTGCPWEIVSRWPGYHHRIAGRITTEADPLEDQHGRKETSCQHGQNQCPDIWAGARCVSEV